MLGFGIDIGGPRSYSLSCDLDCETWWHGRACRLVVWHSKFCNLAFWPCVGSAGSVSAMHCPWKLPSHSAGTYSLAHSLLCSGSKFQQAIHISTRDNGNRNSPYAVPIKCIRKYIYIYIIYETNIDTCMAVHMYALQIVMYLASNEQVGSKPASAILRGALSILTCWRRQLILDIWISWYSTYINLSYVPYTNIFIYIYSMWLAISQHLVIHLKRPCGWKSYRYMASSILPFSEKDNIQKPSISVNNTPEQ